MEVRLRTQAHLGLRRSSNFLFKHLKTVHNFQLFLNLYMCTFFELV